MTLSKLNIGAMPNNGFAGYFVIEKDEDGKRSVAWDVRFASMQNANNQRKKMLRQTRHFASSTLEVGQWDGKKWTGFYEFR